MQRHHCVSWYACSSAFVLVSSAAALADDLAVPRQYRTIEDALAAAAPGDRVVVRGGTFENVQVKKGGVSIVAKGTTVQGYLWIDASNVSVSGFRIGRNGHVVITGDDVTVTGTKAIGRGRQGITVQGGRRARIERTKLTSGDIEVLLGTGAVISDNRLKDGAILTAENGVWIESNTVELINASGDGTSIIGNQCRVVASSGDDCDVSGNQAETSVSIAGDRVTVQGNEQTRGEAASHRVAPSFFVQGDGALVLDNKLTNAGLFVSGDDAVIAENAVVDTHVGLAVVGERFTVAGNTLEVAGIPSFNPEGDGPTNNPALRVLALEEGAVMDNTVIHRASPGMEIDGAGVTISGNDLEGIAAATSILVNGDGNSVLGNQITHEEADRGLGDGIAIVGDGNAVRDNSIDGVPLDAILVWSGTANVVEGNDVAAVPGCGIVVACRASGTTISDCTVSACRFGIVNEGGSTSLTDTSMEGNQVADILDLSSGFSVFDGNSYTTLSRDRVVAPTLTLTQTPFPVDPSMRGD
jgi:hypothetical protein